MNNYQLGKIGEKLAADYLVAEGHKVLEQSYRNPCGEIDIISEKDRIIHFVEVKTRRGTRFGSPSESVDRAKLRHIRNAAKIYINSMEVRNNRIWEKGEFQPRDYVVDVMEVLVNHIEGV